MLEVNYVGNIGQHLNGTTNINIPSPAAGGVQARRPYPQFGNIFYFDTNMSNTYHSLQTTLVRRELAAASGTWLSYTWSKSITTQNIPNVGGNTGREKAISGFDIPHNLAVSVGWEVPIGRGRRFLADAGGVTQALLGGWQMQAILILRSGRPFTPTIAADRANTGVGGQRPNRIGSGELEDPTVERWFDPTAFVLPAQFTYGDSGGNILREGSYRNLDFSVFKRFGDQSGVPRGVLQPDQHAELQRAGHRDRHRDGGARHEHAQHAPAVPVRREVQLLIRPFTEAIA